MLTDFGDEYEAAMKGVILKVNPDANIVDVCRVGAHNIREGAFLLRSVVPYFPDDTIHVGVVDPGVGTERKAIIVEGKQIFVGPDNGLLIPPAKSLGEFAVYEITPSHPSPTFHGRDVFAPIAARISNGAHAEDFGTKTDSFIEIDIEDYEIKEDIISCEVLHVDCFGNVITSIPRGVIEEVLDQGERIALSLFGKSIPFSRTYDDVDMHTPLALIGSHENLEFAVNQGDASKFLGIKTGDTITLKLLK